MPRKKWVPQTAITPALLKFREKRKWQIAFRRYVLEEQACAPYAPYFGLDNKTLRKWFEMQFKDSLSWEDFGKKWQFEHVIPVTCFDFNIEDELKLCWNFVNIRIDLLQKAEDHGSRFDILAAKRFFQSLYKSTLYTPCLQLLHKIERLELSENVDSEQQAAFLLAKKPYLDLIQHYSAFEFELLNSGRTTDEVTKEVNFLKKF